MEKKYSSIKIYYTSICCCLLKCLLIHKITQFLYKQKKKHYHKNIIAIIKNCITYYNNLLIQKNGEQNFRDDDESLSYDSDGNGMPSGSDRG